MIPLEYTDLLPVLLASVAIANPTQTAIDTTLQAHVRDLASCQSSPGAVVIEWSITEEGRATDLRTISNSTGDSGVAVCISDKIRGWIFATSPGVVQHTFKFAAAKGCTTPHADWTFVTSGSFVYGVLPGDFFPTTDMKKNETARTEIAQFLAIEDTGPIHYFKYPDIPTKQQLTGHTANAHSCGRDLHTSSTVERHEITHILAAAVGHPPLLLKEGLAVYLSGAWQGMPIEDYARRAVLGGVWMPLPELVGNDQFRTADKMSPVAAGEAGMLVSWIVRTYGKDKLLELYRVVPVGTSALEVIGTIFGTSLACMDRDIRAHLHWDAQPEVSGCSTLVRDPTR